MEDKFIKTQIKANNIRIVLGILFTIVFWAIFIYKNLLTDFYLILLGSFTLYTLYAYIYVPIKKNKKLKQHNNE
ncbi:hypothetical protein GCM10027429_11660 [Marivirga atlantica]|uniref:Uncharacterized protein n=1 Tax=Marivirga atlantica TaxID=1548457 RepID=A0A937DJD1_9BACT|nr:hypothetical protein [Marivirga atlantica]MBL0764779.1 hypothetical protein [Marivirga atlantica]